jgi:hypothetical protein
LTEARVSRAAWADLREVALARSVADCPAAPLAG